MASNELAIRFTEGKYATRSEVSKELKMSMIDSIWSSILNYRSNFNRYLSVKTIEKNQLVLCLCPTVNALISTTNLKLVRVAKDYSRLNINNGEVTRFEDDCLIKALKYLAKEHDIEVSDNYLRSLIHGDIKEPAPSVRVLVNYLNALNFVKRSYVNPINDDFLAELYSILTGTEELTSFYRSTEDTNRENRVLIDRIYTCAPVALIEGMMDGLFSFIATSQLSSGCKAAIAYYYINYIRPFATFSDEIALLIAKSILAHDGLDEMGALLPIESLISENQEEIARLFVEVQKTSDTTYFVNFALKQLEATIDECVDFMTNLKVSTVREDFYRVDEKKEPVVTPSVSYTTEQPSLFDNQEEKKEVVSEPEVEVQKPEPLVVEKKEEPLVQVREEPSAQVEQIAVSYIPPAIDEKQALRLEQHLLELDPSLRKHEAHFYARHCTLGKSYTIAQYKRMIGCVYETARTAMDHLVELGYYRKDSSNKKFIYTPIPRK